MKIRAKLAAKSPVVVTTKKNYYNYGAKCAEAGLGIGYVAGVGSVGLSIVATKLACKAGYAFGSWLENRKHAKEETPEA